MRIVAGEWGGRVIIAPRGSATRPTSDRVREALFSSLTSILGAGLGDAAVLDAFAGSGALGLEALSRGGRAATFIENDRAALTALRANIAALGAEERVRVVPGDAFAVVGRGALPGGPFSLLLLDPPYRIEAALVRGLIEDAVRTGVLTQDAIVVWEHGSASQVSWPSGLAERTSRRYGDTTVSIAWREVEGES